MKDNYLQIAAGPECEGQRVDQFLAEKLSSSYSRSQIKDWILSGYVSKAGNLTVKKPSEFVSSGDLFGLKIPEPDPVHIEPVEVEFEVLYEDQSLAVIHKPPDIAVHPGPGQQKLTLVNGLIHRFGIKDDASRRPGIVHRLDMPTEGLMVVAKNRNIQRKLSGQFQDRAVQKKYSAFVNGPLKGPSGTIDLPVARNRKDRKRMAVVPTGRPALTHYTIEKTITSKKGRRFSLVDIQIHTGRTHQIRVHFAHLKCPVVGDSLYSRSSDKYRKFGLLLLARQLSFQHPETNEKMTFEIPLPQRFHDFDRLAINL